MSPRQFETEHESRWREFQVVTEQLESGKAVDHVEEFPQNFRRLCQDLNLAQHRIYGNRLCERLNHLVIRSHAMLHRGLAGGWERFFRLLAVTFPRMLRQESRLFWFCSLLFWGPFLALAILGPMFPEWPMAILGPEGMYQADMMYGKGREPIGYLREQHGSNFMMFSFYIFNNVGIDFRIFAGGILAGLGTIFFLIYNGIYLGGFTGYVRHAGDPEIFFNFTCGHSAPELMGIVVSGMAGLRLGMALLSPGRYSRRTALALAGKSALPLIGGAGFLTTWAAVIEGFWSANNFDAATKYGFAAAMWVLVIAYLSLSGRRSSDEA